MLGSGRLPRRKEDVVQVPHCTHLSSTLWQLYKVRPLSPFLDEDMNAQQDAASSTPSFTVLRGQGCDRARLGPLFAWLHAS